MLSYLQCLSWNLCCLYIYGASVGIFLMDFYYCYFNLFFKYKEPVTQASCAHTRLMVVFPAPWKLCASTHTSLLLPSCTLITTNFITHRNHFTSTWENTSKSSPPFLFWCLVLHHLSPFSPTFFFSHSDCIVCRVGFVRPACHALLPVIGCLSDYFLKQIGIRQR